jgi:probable phosphoglycerate mutase
MKQIDFYLFRHGQTDGNFEKRILGQKYDVSLNAKGIFQANELSDNMRDIPLQIIFTSPLKRALETAQIISQKNNIPFIIKDELKECNLGYAEGKLKSEISPDELKCYLSACKNFRFLDGETQLAAATRLINALNQISETSDKQYIGISTHGDIVRYLLSNFFNTPTGYSIPAAVPLHLMYEDGKFEIDKTFISYKLLIPPE